MLNKLLFNELPVEIQEKAKKTLKAFDEVNVIFEYGKYHVSTCICIQAVYADDHEFIGVYKAKDVYTENERMINYIEAFHEYPFNYNGKRDYKMLNDLENEKTWIDIYGNEHTCPNWDAKFNFDDNGNLVRIS